MGAFWERIRKEFPRVEDTVPVTAVVEEPGRTMPEFLVTGLPPLRRTWLISDNGQHLIQIQGDRFVLNWKRASENDGYPSFPAVWERFVQYLSDFFAFCEEIGVGPPVYRQFELTYVNQITSTNGLDEVGLDSLLIDHERNFAESRFLPAPEGINWSTAYLLPDGQGRLHITAQSGTELSSKARIVRLDLTARGITADQSDAARTAWFELAHEWITHGFADITSRELHSDKYWQRTS
ncbi:hypothetical protein WI29_24545 [Burkholderia ubonensis]|nr:hypothetical protein WI31_05915 [Burkholderia ubonensis]KUZ13779.1 hypothetical protein WI29_24545 [Burkholderia ubonensis]KUZ29682.1 hypothetical protein WI32_26670 [Burkholderia ubonensis]KUZ30891.1 hypothetical protein WI30_19260 [Burkholderia ubonensis]KUZ46201.1 hypothetical protein WI33_25020 [Burkholderia ubonensis]